MIYWQLLITFMKIGALSFGGGLAVLPLIEEELVQDLSWLTLEEFVDVLTLSEMTPGPIAINAATAAGNNVAGITGGIVATVGVVLPSLFIVMVLAYIYFKYRNLSLFQGAIEGLRPAVVALIASAGVTIFMTALFSSSSFDVTLSDLNLINLAIFLLALYGLRKIRLSTIQTIILSGIIGGIVFSIV
ncbi:chromate transporter, chromate ion transporter (CHR) family [Alloiococcus otitis]|uniref:Chromate ion transporter (CHR) family chromate transporter n=1 Tax=Alloiococcus otitis ATCC 51267 TaxID=883081 RepID=K9E9P0_9LACT|nr:chromate transporter [Alloiococcus otitis]EKU93914.1 hypothetical protein HMPREF9698_00591 [Alloiococcus otitis ATCC 51267]SUU81735.1 chromate transporter, chromate ion transporter (CHR) family [Alloiococcus otitis]